MVYLLHILRQPIFARRDKAPVHLSAWNFGSSHWLKLSFVPFALLGNHSKSHPNAAPRIHPNSVNILLSNNCLKKSKI